MNRSLLQDRWSFRMQALEIAYRSDETMVALGWPKGKVEIHTVNPDDGSPKELVAKVAFHNADIVHVGFTPQGELVSVSADGAYAVSSAETGAVRISDTVGGQYASAALSLTGRNLFLFSYVDRTASVFRVDVKSGKVTHGPAVSEHLGVSTRVYALTENTGLYWMLREAAKEHVVHEGFCFVDFLSGRLEAKELNGGPASDFNKERLPLDVDPARKLGVRLDHAPVEIIEGAEGKIALMKLELFNLLTLRTARRIVAAGTPAALLDDDEKILLDGDPTSEPYRRARESMQNNITSVRFVPGAEELWFGMRGGTVRRLKLDGSAPSVFVQHSGDADQDRATRDDVFARNLVNNFTLAVSPAGRYVAFGNPNQFFAPGNIGLEGASAPIRLEAPPQSAALSEAPVHVSLTPCGRKLIVAAHDNQFFIVNPADGAIERRVQREPMSGDIVSVDLSPNGKSMAAGVSGGDPFIYEPDDDAVTSLGIPPDTVFTRFLSDTEVVFGHSNGAVVLCNAATGDVLVQRADDKPPAANTAPEDDDEDDDTPTVIADPSYSEFAQLSTMGRAASDNATAHSDSPEQNTPAVDRGKVYCGLELDKFEGGGHVYAGVHFVNDGVHYVGLGNEKGEVQLYAVVNGKLTVDKKLEGISFDPASCFRTMVASGSWLAAPAGANKVVIIDLTNGTRLLELGLEGEVKGLAFGRRTDKLYAFDDRTADLVAVHVPDGQREVIYHHAGPSVRLVDVNEEAQRLVLVEADGTIQLVDLATKKSVCALTITPGAEGVRELVRRA
jgi:WD40 repeat protein